MFRQNSSELDWLPKRNLRQMSEKAPDFVVPVGAMKAAIELETLHTPQTEANRRLVESALNRFTDVDAGARGAVRRRRKYASGQGAPWRRDVKTS